MTVQKIVRCFAFITILCALAAGIYMNYACDGPNVVSGRVVMV